MFQPPLNDSVFSLLYQRRFASGSPAFQEILNEMTYLYSELTRMFNINVFEENGFWYTNATSQAYTSWTDAFLAALSRINGGY